MVQTAKQVDRVAQAGIQRGGYRPKGKRKRQLYILQGLPCVGPQRAEQLLDTFGSVEAVIEADAIELSEVPGIGARTAEAIHDVVREARVTYGSAPGPACKIVP